ncbi:MAG: OmpA family protein [Stenotrophobium sp.]
MKYRSGLLAALLGLTMVLPVYAQDDNGGAAPATDSSTPATDSSSTPAATDTSAAPATDAASAPATDSSSTPAATDTSAAPATDAASAPAADSSSAPAADSGTPAATDTSAAPEASSSDSSSASSDNGGGDSGGSSSGPPSSPIPGRSYYVSPMFSYTLADKARGTKDGYGGAIAVGKKMTRGLNLELLGTYSRFNPKSDVNSTTSPGYSGKFKLSSIGLGAMLFPLSSLPDLYGLISVSYGAGDNLPGPIQNYKSTVFDAGVGYLYPITRNILLRAEARYQMDAHFRGQAGIHSGDKSAFYDGVFNLGLLIPLGSVEQPPPPPPPVAEVVPAPAVAAAPVCANKPADMPEGAAVGADGCPLDSDGDGVPDYKDECPHTPAGAKVLPNGCALVNDCRTPKDGEAVDANGCAASNSFVLKGVNFDFDSARLTEDSKGILDQTAETLKAYPDIKVEVAGNTDDVGSAAYNMGLSERRAESVKEYLASKGVEADRMTPVGYGKTQPLVQGTTAEDRAKNRRVELKPKE